LAGAGETFRPEKPFSGPALPFAVSPFFAALAGGDAGDPVRRQFTPDPREDIRQAGDREDPLGEARYRVFPRLIRQYRDRALIKTTGNCAGFCRFCFRRDWVAEGQGFISEKELAEICGWLPAHSEVRELLLSGGDPLTAPDETLEWLLARLRAARPGDGIYGNILFRVCTRMPVTAPDRLNPRLVGLFRRFRPLRLVVHINHPRELSGPARKALVSCVEAGIPVHVQTVLLRDINDDAGTLALLFRECLNLGLTPYYLFQLDLAPGTAHFRVPLWRGLAVYQELQGRISGLGLPAYAVDLPGGGG
jgi:lysine 2,3-aminomutase